nr:hypothetical protein [uncultured Cohaesibacter sp.]
MMQKTRPQRPFLQTAKTSCPSDTDHLRATLSAQIDKQQSDDGCKEPRRHHQDPLYHRIPDQGMHIALDDSLRQIEAFRCISNHVSPSDFMTIRLAAIDRTPSSTRARRAKAQIHNPMKEKTNRMTLIEPAFHSPSLAHEAAPQVASL